MGTVAVDEHPCVVKPIVGVACDMLPFFQDQHVLPRFRQGTCRNGAGHPRTHYDPIVLHRWYLVRVGFQNFLLSFSSTMRKNAFRLVSLAK